MRKTENIDLIEASLEALDHLNLIGDTGEMDDELKKEVIESFQHTGYLETIQKDKRYVIHYQDEKRNYYMWADSYRPLSDEERKEIEEQ